MAPLPSIETLIDEGGQISVGEIGPILCAAVATDGHNSLAMLKRRPDETLTQLLTRLDKAIDSAWKTDEFVDEINPPPPSRRR